MKYRLGDICSITKGDTGIMKAVAGKYVMVALGEKNKTHNDFQFDCEAVIVPLVSSTGHGHASMKRVKYQEGKFALGSILCAVIPKDKKIVLAKYLHIYLHWNREELLVSQMKGMANVSLPMNKIADVMVTVPSIKQQLNIIELEKKLFNYEKELSNSFTHQLTLLQNLNQAILQEAVQGKLVPQNPTDEPASQLLQRIKAEKETQRQAQGKGKKEKPLAPIKKEEIPFEIPSSWVWCRLGEVGITQTGTTPPTSNKEYFGKDIPFIKPADISILQVNYNNEGLTFEGLKKGVLVKNDSLLMVCIGGSTGKSNYITEDVSCNQQINSIKGLSGITGQFFQYFLQSPFFQKAIWAKSSGGTTPIVNKSKWESIPIPLPPLSEQHRIVAEIEKQFAKTKQLKAHILANQQSAEQLLKALLWEAFEVKK